MVSFKKITLGFDSCPYSNTVVTKTVSNVSCLLPPLSMRNCPETGTVRSHFPNRNIPVNVLPRKTNYRLTNEFGLSQLTLEKYGNLLALMVCPPLKKETFISASNDHKVLTNFKQNIHLSDSYGGHNTEGTSYLVLSNSPSKIILMASRFSSYEAARDDIRCS